MDKVKALENYLISLYKNEEKIIGIFISGSCADDTYDDFSDVDIRFLINSDNLKVDMEMYKDKLNQAEYKILFFEPCYFNNAFITHFDNFIKADVFFYTKEMLIPSPWLENIKIVKDHDNFLETIKNNSKDMIFDFEISLIEEDILKYFATSHECYRRIKRGEYLYANYLMQNMKEIIIQFYDYMHQRASLSWYKLEKRFDETLLSIFDIYISKDMDNIKALNEVNSEFLKIERMLCENNNIDRDFNNDRYILTYYII